MRVPLYSVQHCPIACPDPLTVVASSPSEPVQACYALASPRDPTRSTAGALSPEAEETYEEEAEVAPSSSSGSQGEIWAAEVRDDASKHALPHIH